ncbi:type II secretion system protein GspC [Vibrio sp. RE86]|uniref:type II secretion system protein GspC n=1 Tax=Vibrio sp. RE86 TaxID=2607605 RepID=UPI0014935EDD|nr:type II secretion system protein GspC [Vibrio sp. RE86]NOH80883.1 type II secretion system protein GspC [Vibrio sp. RE86]
MTMLLAISAWTLGRLIWLPWGEESVSRWEPSRSVQSSETAGKSLDISELQNSHLFGEFKQSAAPVVVQPKVQDAPKSRLNVGLVGLVISSNPDKSLAVISNRGKQATYGINETIEGTRAKLIQVQSDRVIIDNAGRNETVMLEGIKFSKMRTQPEPSKQSTVTKTQVPQDTLDKIQQEIRKDAKKIFQYVRLSQVKRDGMIVGYRLSPGKDPALFNSVGLKPGDIAVSINGLDLQDSSAMTEVFKNLSQMSELNLMVERDGQSHEINIEL